MEFTHKLKEIRKYYSLTQENLAEQLNVSRKTVSSWETGRNYPDIETLLKISNKYKVSLNDLLNDDKELVELYKEESKTKSKNNTVNKVSYILNIVLLFLSYLNLNNPWHFRVPLFTFLILTNVIVWIITNDSWQDWKSKSKSVWITSILFFIFQFNLQLSMCNELISHLFHNSMDSYNVGELIGITLRSITILISFLILIFGNKKFTS
ncbi:helix-turn-helix domain-containing protein [Lactobacillus sp. S2-2]|uniref:helix-turn-helix transcriptional regulator n=1 Tax=Lactobacillus sp. S2-2 TaxID=2692917 RepID=UPI001F3A6CB3|nr:helix-turn-helix transcriptional regulator [Lactobacillus sp. S2-2]MCF6515347.1 helix-turn-helix domain-containing protein [Lactobacillus sp. S2-2]